MRHCYSKLKFQKPVEDVVVINKFEKKKSSLAPTWSQKKQYTA